MTEPTELVDLPDPAVQPLVHPLDLPEARRQFRTSWLINSLTDPAVGLCLTAVIWFASRSYIAPLFAGAALIGCGALASRYFATQAWGFIPRKRQDRERQLPASWQLASSLTFAVALAAALLLAVWLLAQSDVPVEVRDVTLGMSVAVGLMVLGDFVRKVLRRQDERKRALYTLPAVAAVLGSVVAAYQVLPEPASPGVPTGTVWGFAGMLAIGAGIGIAKHYAHRRTAEA